MTLLSVGVFLLVIEMSLLNHTSSASRKSSCATGSWNLGFLRITGSPMISGNTGVLTKKRLGYYICTLFCINVDM